MNVNLNEECDVDSFRWCVVFVFAYVCVRVFLSNLTLS
jgi:hypothetical protein